MKTRNVLLMLAASLSVGLAAASAPASAATVVRLPNCQYAGQSVSADLSTTTVVGSVDPHWSVANASGPISGAPGHTTLSAWTALPNNWVQPSAPSATAVGEPAGKYTYAIRFYIPCEPKNYASIGLAGKVAADNEILSVSVNGTAIPGATCSGAGGYCFHPPYGPIGFAASAANLVRGYNTLTVVVNNDGGPSGMAADAHLSARCGKECCELLGKRGADGATSSDEEQSQ